MAQFRSYSVAADLMAVINARDVSHRRGWKPSDLVGTPITTEHIARELAELNDALEESNVSANSDVRTKAHAIEELADVYNCLLHTAYRLGVSFRELDREAERKARLRFVHAAAIVLWENENVADHQPGPTLGCLNCDDGAQCVECHLLSMTNAAYFRAELERRRSATAARAISWLREHWVQLVGADLTARSRPVAYRSDAIIIEVDDAATGLLLSFLEREISGAFAKAFPSIVGHNLRLRFRHTLRAQETSADEGAK